MVSGGLPARPNLRKRRFEASFLIALVLHAWILILIKNHVPPLQNPNVPIVRKPRDIRVQFHQPLKRQLIIPEPKTKTDAPKKASAIAEWDKSVPSESRAKTNSSMVSSVGTALLGKNPDSWSDVKFPSTKWVEPNPKNPVRRGSFQVAQPETPGSGVTLLVDDEEIPYGPQTVLSTKAHALAGFQRRLFEPIGARWRPEVESRFYRNPRVGVFDASYDLILDTSGRVHLSNLTIPSGYDVLDGSILALHLHEWIIPNPPKILFQRRDGSLKSEVKLTIRFKLAVSN